MVRTICFMRLSCTLALIGPGCPFLIIVLVSGVWKLEGHNGFAQGKNLVEKGLGIKANDGEGLAADSDSLSFCSIDNKLRDPPCRHFYQAQVLMQEGENFANRHLIGMGKILYSHQGILVNSGGNSGDEILGPTGRFSFQVALVIHMYFCRPSLCS